MNKLANVVIYSGGMDSFTVLHMAIESARIRGDDPQKTVFPVSFFYGQRHHIELTRAGRVCEELGLKAHFVHLGFIPNLLKGNSSLLAENDIDIPEGHYEAESMRSTVVPGRNTMLLSIGMAYAENFVLSHGFDQALLWYGAHSGDHHIYPDCRAEFVHSFIDLALTATENKVDVEVPFLHGDKTTILRWGLPRKLDYSKTWTCYNGGVELAGNSSKTAHACGKCGSCQERLQAFRDVGVCDPLPYVTREIMPKSES